MTFPTNNLPTQSKFWAREVEKKVTNLESSFSSAEINNTTRDSQLSVTANQALIAAQQAQAAATDANNAINGLVSLSADGSTYEIHGGNLKFGTVTADTVVSSYVYAGDIEASQINAGTVTGLNVSGGTLSTTGTRHVEISGTNANFYDDDGTLSGRVTAGESGRSATIYIGSGTTGVFMSNSNGMELQSSGGPVNVVGGLGLTSAGPISGASLSTPGTLTRTGLAGGGTTGASITDGGNFVRTTSSQRYKTDIQLLDLNLNDLYSLEPKTFKRIDEVEEHGTTARTYPGFIAEELAGTSLDKFVFYSKDENGNDRPEGIHYPELTAALLLAIKDLNARIQALETN